MDATRGMGEGHPSVPPTVSGASGVSPGEASDVPPKILSPEETRDAGIHTIVMSVLDDYVKTGKAHFDMLTKLSMTNEDNKNSIKSACRKIVHKELAAYFPVSADLDREINRVTLEEAIGMLKEIKKLKEAYKEGVNDKQAKPLISGRPFDSYGEPIRDEDWNKVKFFAMAEQKNCTELVHVLRNAGISGPHSRLEADQAISLRQLVEDEDITY